MSVRFRKVRRKRRDERRLENAPGREVRVLCKLANAVEKVEQERAMSRV